jgi:hypothetical protein
MKLVSVKFDTSGIDTLKPGKMRSAMVRALRKAGVTALRDMRSEAVKRVRRLKAIKPSYISRAITTTRARGSVIARMEWAVVVSAKPVPLIAYPHRKVKGRTGRRGIGPKSPGGLWVEVNRGKRTTVRGAFVSRMPSGHEGIFRRTGLSRLPIKELLGSRPVDALLHKGEAEAVAARGGDSLTATFERLLPLELGK